MCIVPARMTLINFLFDDSWYCLGYTFVMTDLDSTILITSGTTKLELLWYVIWNCVIQEKGKEAKTKYKRRRRTVVRRL
jgi:hypothetical protein